MQYNINLFEEFCIYKMIPNFYKYKGYTSNITEQIKNLSGYTEIEYIRLENIDGITDAELNELETILKSGFIVK